MNSANVPPKDIAGEKLPLAKGDIVFYNWDYTGDKYGSGFFGNHVAIVVAASGTDPKSGWTGPLVDEHTTNRKHAIWSLIPYNAQFATTGGWWDTFFNDGPPTRTTKHGLGGRRISGVRSPRMKPGKPPAVSTPTTRSGQRAYSRPLRIEGNVPAAQLSGAEHAFQAGMIERQLLAVPTSPPDTSVALRPGAVALNHMVKVGNRRISRQFAGSALQAQRAALKNARLWEAGSDVRVLGGGADHFHYAQIKRISPTQIEIRGTVRTWAKVAQVQAGQRIVPATPANTLDTLATLTHSATGWKISTLSWAFAPGSQP